MKRYAVETFRCPIDGGALSLHPFSERRIELDAAARDRCGQLGIDPTEAATAVEEGVLVSSSGTWYPIINFVPILLDFTTPLHTEFAERNRGKGPLRSHEPPSRQPRPGEIWVQRSFTAEWDLLGLDTISFGYSADARDAFVELELDWPPELLESPPRILEIGCGSGFESASLDRVARGLVFGVDVNLALLGKGHRLAELVFVNDSIASLFALPMRPKHFDLVYSNGVLHHTHSTREAFDSILPHARQGGAVYVWLYSNEDYDDTIGKRANWTTEELVRPQIARLPRRLQQAVVSILAHRHYRVYSRHGTLGRGSWTYEDSEHSVRDRWTPLFAHRHPFKQVIAWFRRCGMEYKPIDPTVYEDRMRIPLIGVGLRGVMPVSEPRSALLLLSDASACARASATADALAEDGWSVEVAAPEGAAAGLDVSAAVRVTTANACPYLGELPNPPAVAALRRIPWERVAASYEALVAAASSDARAVLVAFDLPALAAGAVGATVHGARLVYDVGESFAERSQFRQDGLEALLLDVEGWLARYADAVTAASPALAEVTAARSGIEYPEVVFDSDPATTEEPFRAELEPTTRAAQELQTRLAPGARAEQLVSIFDEIAAREPHATDASVVADVRLRGEQLATDHATTLGLVGDLSVVSGRTLAKELARRASRRAVRRAGAIRSAVTPSARDRGDQ